MSKTRNEPPRIQNRKARHDFEIIDTLEAGISLTGSEVKSLRAGQASLDGAYAHIRDGELFLVDANINPYERAAEMFQHKPKRVRKLLAKRTEIKKLLSKVTQKGFTLVPLMMYFNERGLVKVSLALATGKSHADKRQTLRARDDQREMNRAMRRR
ncbi:MAG: SsrA-binding protein SmpB [Phycisphaerales bacterium]|nr:SsrA-binding protein SmpB [Phycisphaerales bacterium]